MGTRKFNPQQVGATAGRAASQGRATTPVGAARSACARPGRNLVSVRLAPCPPRTPAPIPPGTPAPTPPPWKAEVADKDDVVEAVEVIEAVEPVEVVESIIPNETA